MCCIGIVDRHQQLNGRILVPEKGGQLEKIAENLEKSMSHNVIAYDVSLNDSYLAMTSYISSSSSRISFDRGTLIFFSGKGMDNGYRRAW
jgi:hypothetical protein